jgi:hypothetical protein
LFLANPTGGLEACRYADVAFPEPGEYEPQQIHIMPASAHSPTPAPDGIRVFIITRLSSGSMTSQSWALRRRHG